MFGTKVAHTIPWWTARDTDAASSAPTPIKKAITQATSHTGVPRTHRSPRPPKKASTRRPTNTTPGATPMSTAAAAMQLRPLPVMTSIPWITWCGPQLSAMAT